jgi:hypothetical protein
LTLFAENFLVFGSLKIKSNTLMKFYLLPLLPSLLISWLSSFQTFFNSTVKEYRKAGALKHNGCAQVTETNWGTKEDYLDFLTNNNLIK